MSKIGFRSDEKYQRWSFLFMQARRYGSIYYDTKKWEEPFDANHRSQNPHERIGGVARSPDQKKVAKLILLLAPHSLYVSRHDTAKFSRAKYHKAKVYCSTKQSVPPTNNRLQ